MKLFICTACNNLVEIIEFHEVPMQCCGQKMKLLEPNTQENVSLEKHLPVAKLEGNLLEVTVGEVLHPSASAHYIGFIAIKMKDLIIRQDITIPNDPKARFIIGDYKGIIEVYEWCNLHGLWKISIEA